MKRLRLREISAMIATISCWSNDLAMAMKAKKPVRVLEVIFLTKKCEERNFQYRENLPLPLGGSNLSFVMRFSQGKRYPYMSYPTCSFNYRSENKQIKKLQPSVKESCGDKTKKIGKTASNHVCERHFFEIKMSVLRVSEDKNSLSVKEALAH